MQGAEKIGPEFLVDTQPLNDRQSSAGLTNGGFVVTWSDGNPLSDGSGSDGSGTGIKAQIFSADGAKVGGEFLVNTQTTNYQVSPTITGLNSGGFVVTWTDNNPLSDASGTSIKAQMFGADGAKVGSELLVNTPTTNSQLSPTITGLVSGGFVVTWSEQPPFPGSGPIKVQMFGADGAKVGGEFLVNTQITNSQK